MTAACVPSGPVARTLRRHAPMKDTGGDRSAREREPFLDETQDDPGASAENAEPYFPPTDPVVRETDGPPRIEGGFADTSMDGVARAPRTHVGGPADEALADDVRRALRRDAATADLELEVAVADGVATLRGRVSDLTDTDSALAVAGRVPGIADVVDEIEVEAGAG